MRYIEAKSILSKLKKEDPWFGITYNMNLYRGCSHGCIYCDTRSDCYRIGNISQVSVKENALELLPLELRTKRGRKGTIGTGSMNDPYMPIERELLFTRRALQIIASHRYPVHVITKSDLVVRDVDVLEDISRTYAAVSFTITTASDLLARKLEPYAPATSERFKSMKALAERGIYTGVTMMPMLPFINDTKKNVEVIVKQAQDAGASYILPMFGVTLRKGSRDYFYDSRGKNFPGIKARYQSSFGEQYECYSPDYRALSDMFFELCAKLGMDTKMRFFEPITQQLSLF